MKKAIVIFFITVPLFAYAVYDNPSIPSPKVTPRVSQFGGREQSKDYLFFWQNGKLMIGAGNMINDTLQVWQESLNTQLAKQRHVNTMPMRNESMMHFMKMEYEKHMKRVRIENYFRMLREENIKNSVFPK